MKKLTSALEAYDAARCTEDRRRAADKVVEAARAIPSDDVLRAALQEIVDHNTRRAVPGSHGRMVDVTAAVLQGIARKALEEAK